MATEKDYTHCPACGRKKVRLVRAEPPFYRCTYCKATVPPPAENG